MRFLDHLSRTVRGRSRTVSGPLVLAGVAMLSLAPIASAMPATAAAAADRGRGSRSAGSGVAVRGEGSVIMLGGVVSEEKPRYMQ